MKPESTWAYARCFSHHAKKENLSTHLREQRKLRQRQSPRPHTPNSAAAQQTRRGGGAEESKRKAARAGGWAWRCRPCGPSGCSAAAAAAAAVAVEQVLVPPSPALDRGAASDRQPPSGYPPRAYLCVSFSPFPFPSLGWGRGVPERCHSWWSPFPQFCDVSGVSELGLRQRTSSVPHDVDLFSLSHAFANHKIFFSRKDWWLWIYVMHTK